MDELDVAVIGGGPAGLTAGLYAARARLRVALFERAGLGGEIANTALVEDYPGIRSISGAELAERMAEHARDFGLETRIDEVRSVERADEAHVLTLASGAQVRALTVIVAAGGEPTKLGVPGEAEFHGRGVSYCAVCDGAFFRDQDIAVVGGGDSAFQETLFLARYARRIYLIHRRADFRAQAVLQERVLADPKVQVCTPRQVREIGGPPGGVEWVEVSTDDDPADRERIPVSGVFVFIGFTPRGRELFSAHLAHDAAGYIVTDQLMRTTVPGVYAVGDCRAQLARQVTTAVGDATTAALHADRYVSELKAAHRGA